MIVAATPSLYATLGMAAFIVWRMYARIRRMVGRQKLSSVRPWLTVTFFPILFALLLLTALVQPAHALALAAGAAVGIVLGVIGKRLTRFEVTPQGLYYTPSAHLGIALSLLFAGRIVYRMVQMNIMISPGQPPASFVGNPLTLAIFGTLAGYYVCYAICLLLWRRQVEANGGIPGLPEQTEA